jgi:hypothetical protein
VAKTTTEQFPHVDFDLHGLAGVRLVDASERDISVVSRQLGPIQSRLSRDPDITIRFVDRLPISNSLRYLGVDDAGFSDNGLLLLQGKNGSSIRVQIPFEQIGKHCEIVCERGLSKVPLLIPILNLTVLSKGIIPLHAAAFTYQGTGIVVTGWSKGGKTETLLAFMARGAVYVGDEWVYLSTDGRRMYGVPEPIRLWQSHLQDLPEFRQRIPFTDRAKLQTLKLFIKLAEQSSGSAKNASALHVSSRLVRLLKRQQYVQLPPQQLFGSPLRPFICTPEKIFFVVSHEAPDVRVEPLDPQELARRMVFSLQTERLDFMSYYLKFRFAFPDLRNEFIEQAEETQRDLLCKALANKPCYAVYHPYPAPIPALYEAINPLLNKSCSQLH